MGVLVVEQTMDHQMELEGHCLVLRGLLEDL